MNAENPQPNSPACPQSSCSALLGRYVNLPNFLPSTLPVAAMVCVARWSEYDAVIAWWSMGMLILHAIVGLCDIMANHYLKKLMELTSHELALSA